MSPGTKRLVCECSLMDDIEIAMLPIEALGLFLRARLKVSHYKIFQQARKNIFPRYDLLPDVQKSIVIQ